MSADVLRRAAALMRQRAEKAEASGDGEPWYPTEELHALIGGGSRNTADAEHIASWHPAVALAVADWLNLIATAAERDLPVAFYDSALTVAHAYLGTADV